MGPVSDFHIGAGIHSLVYVVYRNCITLLAPPHSAHVFPADNKGAKNATNVPPSCPELVYRFYQLSASLREDWSRPGLSDPRDDMLLFLGGDWPQNRPSQSALNVAPRIRRWLF